MCYLYNTNKMRFKRNSTQNSENNSDASSVLTSNSFGLISLGCSIFGSDCSDFSDCQCLEENKQNKKYSKRVSKSCESLSFLSVTERETYPLLLTPKLTYNTLSSSSDTLGPADFSANDIITTYKKTIEGSVKTDKNKQNSLVTIFSIWNTIMGSSLLAMAWGVERAGLPAALLLMVTMAGLCLYTAHILLRVNVHHGGGSCEVPTLCRTLLGAAAAAVAHVFSLLVLLGSTLVYWLLMANFLYYTVNYFMDASVSNNRIYDLNVLCPKRDALAASPSVDQESSPYWGLHTTVPFVVAIFMLPLLCFKKVSFFTKFTSFGTLSVFYLLIFVIVKAWMWGVNLKAVDIKWEGLDGASNAAVLSGMLALSFYIHNIIITIMNNNANQEKNGRDLSIAFLLVTVTYTLVGIVFFICFPLDKDCIEDNILNNFDKHDVMTVIARILLLFQVVSVYPLVVCMAVSAAARLHGGAAARGPALALRGAMMAACVAVACLCPYVGVIIRYTGAVSGLVHVFALPSLLQMRSLQLRGKLTTWKIIFYSIIIIFGAVNLCMQFFIT